MMDDKAGIPGHLLVEKAQSPARELKFDFPYGDDFVQFLENEARFLHRLSPISRRCPISVFIRQQSEECKPRFYKLWRCLRLATVPVTVAFYPTLQSGGPINPVGSREMEVLPNPAEWWPH
ncbi:unnamed protein product [Cyprideis torosa]|uniref:Uncharacterized protein n=1 Tax=Cyprideis torosa TaxID=163714 RepID=A0A7R8WHU7_9CRUS|nr:unnamed protein product [Cyprideis torosa]CAG0893393.1 unnamed protein product [Cyprideis torosa]